MLDYVLLSYADGPLNAKDENDPFISKLGGKPFGSIWDTDEIDNNASKAGAEIKDIPKSDSFASPIIPKQEKNKPSSIKTEVSNSNSKNKAKPAKINSNVDSIISSMNELSISNKNCIPDILPYAPAQYLDSEYEHLDSFSDSIISENILSKSQSTGKQNSKISNDENDSSESWASEAYESTILPNGIDSALDVFMGIVSQNPEQILRYHFSGTPLFYSMNDEVSKLLLVPPKNSIKNSHKPIQALASSSNINKINPEKNNTQNQQLSKIAKAAKPKMDGTKGYGIGSDDDDDDEDISNNGDSSEKNQISYSTENVPVCQYCKGKRTFELQVLPSIIHIMGFNKLSNNINSTSIIEPSNNQQHKIITDSTDSKKPSTGVLIDKNNLIKGREFMESIDSGMEFGTLLIYSCKNDCHLSSSELPDLSNAKEIEKFSIPQYYQEVVYTQLETHLD
ncbi:hypothetical protein AYI69_g4468 [Smittium culicis]|uniref:Programmed cell death protein 2 C-terminal domain-containing protein n=1 Tax=Smittium culicis TaxID=133412 RepID=A0A1R1YDG6_9FUNG|nr:hypothetical protein AYI69_g4468 [Smittium culicis]